MPENSDDKDWWIERASWALRKISLELAAREAMKFIECRRKGGTFAECHGIYRVTPFPSSGDPSLDEKLNKLSVKERKEALLFMKEELLARVKMIDEKLEKM